MGTPVRSKLFLASLSLNLLFLLIACAHSLNGTPKWDGKLWAGYSAGGNVRRTQDPAPNTISAFDPQFDNMVCMTYQDLSCMYFSFVDNCRDWYTLNPSCPSISKQKMAKYAAQYEQFQASRKKK